MVHRVGPRVIKRDREFFFYAQPSASLIVLKSFQKTIKLSSYNRHLQMILTIVSLG